MTSIKLIPIKNHEEICFLLRKRLIATRTEQKVIRAKIRKLGFNISDYWTGFTDNDFRKLIKSKGKSEIQEQRKAVIPPQKKPLEKAKSLSTRLKNALSPIIDSNTEVIILGSMPGEKSLKYQMYYHNHRNQFWKIIFSIINNSEIPTEYNKKIEILQKYKIGLWDVLEVCERDGSLDNNIKNGKVNDFDSFFKKYPHIKVVGFNGQKSYSDFVSSVGFIHGKKYILLPSSSSANTQNFLTKTREWQTAINK
jgi:hypoxanthine-DNA glycosylase